MSLVVSKQQARNFLIKKQLLAEQRKSGYEGIKYVFDKLRVVQYDPLNPCGRNPDLILQARVDNYHPADYYKWLYDKRLGIECYDKVLCIIPIEDYPFTAHNRKNLSLHPEVKTYFKENKKDFEDLIEHIKKNGPVSSSDIDNTGKSYGKNWYGYGHNWGKFALELLWKTGQVVISKRIKGNKYYDLPEKVYGKEYFINSKHVEAEHILRRIGSVGIMRARGMTDAWRGVGTSKQKNEIVKKLIENGELTEVLVEGIRTSYVILTQDKKLFDQEVEFRDEMLFIAPLDTLIWDRNMIEEFFDFRYRWEVYVPASKREYSYYVLPILYKDQFVGRIEPMLQGDTLVIKNVWKEKNVKWTNEMENILQNSIMRFQKYLQADKVVTASE